MEFTSCKLDLGGVEEIIIIITHLIDFYSYEIYHETWQRKLVSRPIRTYPHSELDHGNISVDVVIIIIINNSVIPPSGCLDRCRHKITWKYHFLMFNDSERSFLVHQDMGLSHSRKLSRNFCK